MDELTPPKDLLLAGLAIYGEATADEVATLLQIESCKLGLNSLTADAAISRAQDRFQMAATQAEAQLALLREQDAQLHDSLQQRALELDAARIAAGEQALEPRFAKLLNRFATQLMQESPATFQQLIEWLTSFNFQDVPLRQLVAYFVGVCLARQDRYPEALAQLETLLAQPTLEPELRGRALNSQAIYLQLTGQIELAQAGYAAALELWRSLDNRTRQGMALLNLGILSYQLQQYTAAQDRLLQAAALFAATGNDYQLGSVQNQLGLLYRDQGLLNDAAACFDEVAAQRRRIADTESLGRALNNRGEVRLFQANITGAADDFKEALTLLQARTFAVDVHLNLGLTQQVGNDLTGACQSFQTALTIAETIGRRDILAEIHYRLAESWRRLGNDALALTHFEAAAQVVDSSQSMIRSEQLRIGLLGRWQQIYEALVLHCWRMGESERAFAWAERARARAFVDALYPAARTERYQREIIAQASELLAVLSPQQALLCYFTTGVLEQEMPLFATLKRDHPLAEHLLLPAKTLCFELINGQLRLRDCLLDPNAFASLSPRQDRNRLLTPAILKRLYSQLIAADLSGQQSIYLSPHGPLHQVPFAALLDSQGQPLLAAGDAPLIYVPSGSILLQRMRVSAQNPAQWALGEQEDHTLRLMDLSPMRDHGADYSWHTCLAVGCDVAGDWGELRHSEREAMLIARLCQGDVLTGASPKLDCLRTESAHYRWLHFACHGWFDPLNPLESYLQTGAEERLRAQEVLDTWHLQAELVTLSACQSGVQKVLRSDEPMGLVRGFLAAGARWVLATQWPVADLPTFLLMLYFYRQLTDQIREGAPLTPAAALRRAQLWLRSLSLAEAQQLAAALSGAEAEIGDLSQPFDEPRFWAGFVVYGG
ncbi:MAG: CHAT domain-containing tetratricopeptide repeat protein [Caldilineaceae bacterium]